MSAQANRYPFPIMARHMTWLVFSGLIILAGIAKMGYNNQTTGQGLAFGIDFTGGASYVYKFGTLPGETSAQRISAVRAALPAGLSGAKVLVFGEDEVQIRTATGSKDDSVATALDDSAAEAAAILTALQANFGDVELVASDLVGPVIGEHLRVKGLQALVIGCVLILAYITFRYNIGGMGGGVLFGICAVVALVHDVFIMLAVYAFAMTELNTSFVAAILTIVGYSVNDTVIIFDRIRENIRLMDAPRRRNMDEVEATIEMSLWQTMTRSVVTSGTTLMPLLGLFLFGGVTIKDFAFALLIGLMSGAYSSIFVASPMFMWLTRRQAAKTGDPTHMPTRDAARRQRTRQAAAASTTKPKPSESAAKPAKPKPEKPAPATSPAAAARPTASSDSTDAASSGDTEASGGARAAANKKPVKRKKRRH